MILGITGRSRDGKSALTNYLNLLITNYKVIIVDDIDISIIVNHSGELIEINDLEISTYAIPRTLEYR